MGSEKQLQATVRRALRDAGITAEQQLVLGVSGGPDSLCMLYAVAASHPRARLTVAHLNHQLRDSAESDAQFVAAQAHALGIECVVATVDVAYHAQQNKQSVEVAARQARHRFLVDTARAHAAAAVLLAHHLDDQAETVLLNIMRGTGTRGLGGMLPVAAHWLNDAHDLQIIRPLLSIPRATIVAYCAANDLEPRHDETNDDVAILRNRVRHQLLPALAAVRPSINEQLADLANLSQADDHLLDSLAVAQLETLTQAKFGRSVILDAALWRDTHLALQRRMLQLVVTQLAGQAVEVSSATILAACELAATAEAGSIAKLPAGVRLLVEAKRLRIAVGPFPIDEPQVGNDVLPLSVPGTVELENGWRISAELADEATDGLAIVAVPEGTGLVVRKPAASERIQPLGMSGQHKRITAVLADAKVPRVARTNWPVVATEAHVVWVAGHALDERAQPPATADALIRVTLERASGAAP